MRCWMHSLKRMTGYWLCSVRSPPVSPLHLLLSSATRISVSPPPYPLPCIIPLLCFCLPPLHLQVPYSCCVCHPKSGLYHRNPSFTDDAADKSSQDCLAALESIDDDLDEKNILAVKMADTVEARNYGVKKFPSVIVFVKKIPELYEGIRFILLAVSSNCFDLE